MIINNEVQNLIKTQAASTNLSQNLIFVLYYEIQI